MAYYDNFSRKQLVDLLTIFRDKNSKLKEELKFLREQENLQSKYEILCKSVEKLKQEKVELQNKIYKQFSDNQKMKIDLNTYKENLKLMITKNKRIFGHYFEKLGEVDEFKISTSAIILDFEYVIAFQKFLEMHIYDYIVDRQYSVSKTEEENQNLIQICKEFTNKVFKNDIYKTSVGVETFKKDFLEFSSKFIEVH